MLLGPEPSTIKKSRRSCCCCSWSICPRVGLLCLSAVISLSCTNGEIRAYNEGAVPTVYQDIPSDPSLGPPVPHNFTGVLTLSVPRDACSPIQIIPHPSFDMSNTMFNKSVVLIERSYPDAKVRCTF